GQTSAFDAICLRALAKDPADRFGTAGELARGLERALAADEGAAPRVPGLGLAAAAVGAALVALFLLLGDRAVAPPSSEDSVVERAARLLAAGDPQAELVALEVTG